MDRKDDGAWFKPHRWGYGVGMPIAWQGWVMLGCQIAAASWGVVYFAGNEDAQLGVLMAVIILPFPLMIAKTRGGWRWRWGERE